jgi:hypothetical protein
LKSLPTTVSKAYQLQYQKLTNYSIKSLPTTVSKAYQLQYIEKLTNYSGNSPKNKEAAMDCANVF